MSSKRSETSGVLSRLSSATTTTSRRSSKRNVQLTSPMSCSVSTVFSLFGVSLVLIQERAEPARENELQSLAAPDTLQLRIGRFRADMFFVPQLQDVAPQVRVLSAKGVSKRVLDGLSESATHFRP